jgi:ABC-type branched-subunit amino acid transport system ATPase component
MLKLSNVVSGYAQTTIVQGITHTVSPGEISVLLGRNGVGKTTLLRTIAGQLPLQDGEITLGEQDISHTAAFRRARLGLSYVPQGRDIFPALSVRDNLRVAVQGMRQRSWQRRLDRTLEQFPALTDKLDAPGRSLSGGQQQIVAIARALITDPDVLLLDEPSEGIQPSIVVEIADMLTRMAAERGIAVLVAEQNLDFVRHVTKRVEVIDKGKLVTWLHVSDLLSDSELQHHYLGV